MAHSEDETGRVHVEHGQTTKGDVSPKVNGAFEAATEGGHNDPECALQSLNQNAWTHTWKVWNLGVYICLHDQR